MSAHCQCGRIAGKQRRTGRLGMCVGRAAAAGAWIAPGAVLALLPKCPACLAAYIGLWTGLGISISAAGYLRTVIIVACSAVFVFLIANTVLRFRHRPNRESRCGTPTFTEELP